MEFKKRCVVDAELKLGHDELRSLYNICTTYMLQNGKPSEDYTLAEAIKLFIKDSGAVR